MRKRTPVKKTFRTDNTPLGRSIDAILAILLDLRDLENLIVRQTPPDYEQLDLVLHPLRSMIDHYHKLSSALAFDDETDSETCQIAWHEVYQAVEKNEPDKILQTAKEYTRLVKEHRTRTAIRQRFENYKRPIHGPRKDMNIGPDDDFKPLSMPDRVTPTTPPLVKHLSSTRKDSNVESRGEDTQG